MGLSKRKKSGGGGGGRRVLVTINVLGSAGPLRFVVNDDEIVVNVIDLALKLYARGGRLPFLGSDVRDFLLYCPLSGSDALNPREMIGAHGSRNFVLCKKPEAQKTEEVEPRAAGITRKGSGSWKSWINKTLNLNIASH